MTRRNGVGSETKCLEKDHSKITWAVRPHKKNKTSEDRSFQDKWSIEFPWLKFESSKLYCTLCIKCQKKNTFTTGCSVLKKDNVRKHGKGKEHKDAVEVSKQWKSVKTAVVNAASKSEEAVTAAMRNVYFAAKEHLPSSIVPDLNKLCIRQGVTKLNHLQTDAHTTYEHSTSIDDFQECIMTTINEDIIKSVEQSKKYSIMIDESTDISVKQNLVTYIRVLSVDICGNVKLETYFLGLKELYRADAQSIYCKVVELLNDKNIKLNGLCSISTDGASVMAGHKSGVVKRLKDCPWGLGYSLYRS